MFGLVFGAITGGLIMWYWGDRIRDFAADNMTGARKSTADRLRSVADTTEGAPDRATETTPSRASRPDADVSGRVTAPDFLNC